MLKSIELKNVNLRAFAEAPHCGASSEVWGVGLCFERGKSYLIEAASGRGKSSLCAFLCGLRSDYTGEINLVDDVRGKLPLEQRDAVELRSISLAVMFQELRLFPELSVLDNVLIKNRLTGFATEHSIRDMLCRVGLGRWLDMPCGNLSFGQQQRVAFVRALCQPCDFIILDEPVSHLDKENAAVMAEMLHRRQRKDGVGVIVTSIGYRLPYEYDVVLKL